MALKLWRQGNTLISKNGRLCLSESCPCGPPPITCHSATGGLAAQQFKIDIGNLSGVCASKYNGTYFVDFYEDLVSPSTNRCSWDVLIPPNDGACACTNGVGGSTQVCRVLFQIGDTVRGGTVAQATVSLEITRTDNTFSSLLVWISPGTTMKNNMVSGTPISFYPVWHSATTPIAYPTSSSAISTISPCHGWNTSTPSDTFQLLNGTPFGAGYSFIPFGPAIPGGWSLGASGSGMYDIAGQGVSNTNPATCVVTAVV